MMLLGNFGQQLDISDLSEAVNRMRDNFAQNDSVDQSQDAEIRKLQVENRELKLYLSTVVRLLVTKGVLTQAEIDATVQAVEKV